MRNAVGSEEFCHCFRSVQSNQLAGHFIPEYFGSNFSNFRNRSFTSSGSSTGFSEMASAPSTSFASPFSVASPEPAAAVDEGVSVSSLAGRGVFDLLGSLSSPITKSGSNSEGSGPFPVGESLEPFGRRFDGEAVRAPLLEVEADLAGDCRWSCKAF